MTTNLFNLNPGTVAAGSTWVTPDGQRWRSTGRGVDGYIMKAVDGDERRAFDETFTLAPKAERRLSPSGTNRYGDQLRAGQICRHVGSGPTGLTALLVSIEAGMGTWEVVKPWGWNGPEGLDRPVNAGLTYKVGDVLTLALSDWVEDED